MIGHSTVRREGQELFSLPWSWLVVVAGSWAVFAIIWSIKFPDLFPLQIPSLLHLAAVALVALWLVWEGFVFCLVTVSIDRLPISALCRAICRGGLFVLTAVYLIWILSFEIAFLRYGTMPQLEDLRLVRYLFEPVTYSEYFTRGDTALFCATLLVLFAIVLMQMNRCRSLALRGLNNGDRAVRQAKKIVCTLGLVFGAFVVCSRFVIPLDFSKQFFGDMAADTVPQGVILSRLMVPHLTYSQFHSSCEVLRNIRLMRLK